MATTSDRRLELHIFGAAKGESIVVRLPDGQWGVVDCFASSLNDTGTNPTLQFLVDQGVKELAFLCLTHPHDDHYRGMSHLLQGLQIRSFWRPAAMTGKRLSWLVKSIRKDAAKSGDLRQRQKADELQQIFQLVKDQKNSTGQPVIPKSATTGTQLFPIPVDANAEFQVWAIAPSTTQTERYEQRLSNCFDANGKFIRAAPHSDHNIISMALLLKFGKTRIVLGGDVESAGWNDVSEEFGVDQLASHAIKVSHHGSTNGYTNDLWRHFSRECKPIAVVTPYHSQGLPEQNALLHIKASCAKVFTPCLPAVRLAGLPAFSFSPKAPIQSRIAIHKQFKARASSSFPTGRCSFVFDAEGTCVDSEFDQSAGDIFA